MVVPIQQEKLFRKYLLEAVNDAGLPLPDNWEIDKVYKEEYCKYGMRGCRKIAFIIKMDYESELYLDFYLETDDYSAHKRIKQSGDILTLENFEGQYGWPIYEDEERTKLEHQRIREHNQKVNQILIEKGLIK